MISEVTEEVTEDTQQIFSICKTPTWLMETIKIKITVASILKTRAKVLQSCIFHETDHTGKTQS